MKSYFCVGEEGNVICILQLHDGYLRTLGLGLETIYKRKINKQ